MSNHSKYPKEAGIYKLTCVNNGKVYIGKAVNIKKRLGEHKICKRVGYLQNAIVKHGWDSFRVDILETIKNFNKLLDNDLLLEKESEYIKSYDSCNPEKGYNLCKFSRDKTGIPHSEETKEKMSRTKLGKKCSEETKEKLRQANLGKKLSKETREKMRNRMLGNTLGVGHVHSEETRAKMSLKTLSEDHKEKLRLSRLGKSHTKEAREKIRQGKLGKKFTEEHRENLRKSHLKQNNIN